MFFRIPIIRFLIILASLLLPACQQGEASQPAPLQSLSDHLIIDLAGVHKFHPGDQAEFADPQLDDANWEVLQVPRGWRRQGVAPWVYTGWYRIWFDMPQLADKEGLAAVLGITYLVDEVFLNGQRIGGEGRWKAGTTYDRTYPPVKLRVYPLPADLLVPGGRNLLAVRVGRHLTEGGIASGPVGIAPATPALEAKRELDWRYTALQWGFAGSDLFLVLACTLALLLGIRTRALISFAASGTCWLVAWFMDGHIFFDLGWETVLSQKVVYFLLGGPALIFLIEFMAALLGRKPGPAVRALQCALFVSIVAVLLPSDWPGGEIWLAAWTILFVATLIGTYSLTLFWSYHAVRTGKGYMWPLVLGCAAMLVSAIFDMFTSSAGFGAQTGQLSGDFGARAFGICMALTLGAHYIWTQNRLHEAGARIMDAHEEERRRLARDIHDGVGQWLSMLEFDLDMVRSKSRSNAETTADILKRLTDNVRNASADTRRIAHDLSPALMAKADFAEVLKTHAARISAASECSVHVEVAPLPDLDARTRDHLYRIFQEAVKNAIRHGSAGKVDVSVSFDGNVLTMQIVDDGSGFEVNQRNPDGRSLGLASVLERAELLGGWARIISRPGGGTRVSITVPASGSQHA